MIAHFLFAMLAAFIVEFIKLGFRWVVKVLRAKRKPK